MIVYLAGPISGKGYNEVVRFYERRQKFLEGAGWTTLHPMTAKGILRNEINFREHGYNNPISSNHAIFERDKWMVSKCDVLLADFSEADRVSIGSVMELAWASMAGKHTIVVLPAENPHRHAFVLEAADIVFESTDLALGYLEKLINNSL